MKMNKKGFTLIEMLVVIAIIAILVAIVVPTVSAATLKSKAAADAANMRTIAAEAAIEYLNDETITTEFTLKSKVVGSDLTVAFTVDGTGNLVPTVVINGDTVGVEYFAHIADKGTAEGAPIAAACTHKDDNTDGKCDICGKDA